MKEILIVGLGGFLGSIARFKLGGLILHHSENWRFPLSTFLINVLGCALIGILAGAAEKWHLFSGDIRLLVFTGFLGGFTTFSAFGYEGAYLIRRGEPLIALAYAGASVGVGIVAVWLAIRWIHPEG